MRANTTAEVHCVFPYAFQPTYISTSQETRRSENKTTSVAGVRENNLNNLHRVVVSAFSMRGFHSADSSIVAAGYGK